MLDNTKFRTSNKTVISKLLLHPNFTPKTSRNNRIAKFNHKTIGTKLRIELCKEFNRGQFTGYEFADISISPHYHFNQYRHNGNDFTPTDCIKTIINMLEYVGIKPSEYEDLKVVNIEFGLNIIPEIDIKSLIDGLFFYKKTPFRTGNFPYFKKTDATSYKQIKAYAKGLQFADFPQYSINPNTFRFEVKSKQAKNIKKYGIETANDLIKPDIYNRLSQVLLDEWEQILLINLEPKNDDLNDLKDDEVQFIKDSKKFDFWNDMIQTKYRNKFGRYKEKYHSILDTKNNLHHLIKLQIIDKLHYLQSGANSTQKTPINRGKVIFEQTPSILINLESAPLTKNIKVCLVTGLDISMQKKGSKYLCFAGLKYYRENKIEIYRDLEKKYLTDKMRVQTIEKQMYYIAHNIRNRNTNQNHNPRYSRKRFEERNYHKNQLQLFD